LSKVLPILVLQGKHGYVDMISGTQLVGKSWSQKLLLLPLTGVFCVSLALLLKNSQKRMTANIIIWTRVRIHRPTSRWTSERSHNSMSSISNRPSP